MAIKGDKIKYKESGFYDLPSWFTGRKHQLFCNPCATFLEGND